MPSADKPMTIGRAFARSLRNVAATAMTIGLWLHIMNAHTLVLVTVR